MTLPQTSIQRGGASGVARTDAEFAASVEARMQQMFASVKALLAENRNTILLVAEELAREKVLSAGEIKQILKLARGASLVEDGC